MSQLEEQYQDIKSYYEEVKGKQFISFNQFKKEMQASEAKQQREYKAFVKRHNWNYGG